MKKTIILFILFLVFSFLHSQHSEDFETGDFSSLDWQMDGDADWLVTSYQPIAGNFCAQTDYLFSRLPNTTFYITVNNTGSIEGNISDDVGNPLIGADVILEQSQTQKFSNGSGYYLFGNIIERII